MAQAAQNLSLRNKLESQHEFGAFCQHVRGFSLAGHHVEWAEVLQNRAYQEGDDPRTAKIVPIRTEIKVNNRWIIIEAPRNHAKSTEFTVSYPLWRIGKNRNHRIVIVCNTQSQSTSFLREITQELERNEKYKEVFGNLVPTMPEKWTQHEIIIDRTATHLKDPTISATSMGGTVLSKRADEIICDDILSQDNTKTADQREKVRQWFFEVLLPVLEPGGRLIVVGTAWNSEDLYQQLLGDDSFQVRKVYDAIVDEETQTTLWPERWPYEELMRLKKSMGTQSFNKAYRNIAVSAEDAVFKVEWLNRARERGKNRKLIRSLDYAKWDLGKMMVTNGIDLAISQRDTADYTAMMVLGRTRDGMKIPLWAIRERLTPAEVRQYIIEIQNSFSPSIQMVETNGYQEALRRDIADETDIPIRGYQTGGEKYDADIGINSLAVEFENDKWILPYDREDDYTRRLMDILIDGLLSFPNGHTEDLVMATWFANTAMRDLTASKGEGQAIVKRHNIFGGR